MLKFLSRNIDARPLALGRILIGLAAVPITLEWAIPLLRVASGDYLGLPVFQWWNVLPTTTVLALVSLALAAALAMVAGLAGRLPALIVAACSAVALASDQQAYSNHLLLLATLATYMGLSGAANAFSIRLGTKSSPTVPYWPAFLIKMQVTSVYAWTAASKINEQFLSGDILRMQVHSWIPLPEQLLPTLAVMGIATEAFLAIALWLPKLRLLAFIVGAGLHLGIVIMLQNPAPLIPFAMLMASGYILFAHDSLQARQWKLPRFARRAKAQATTGTLA